MTYNAMISAIPMPARIRALPVTKKGFPALFFSTMIGDDYDLRVANDVKKHACLTKNLCWLCGQKLGKFKAFVIGPMCVINRVTSEPPCHLECAEYATKACPFLTKPRMVRNTADLPVGTHNAPGEMIERNPGATCIYVTTEYRLMKVKGGVLIRLVLEPMMVQWWANGQRCGRGPVMDSIESGYPALMDMAKAEGSHAVFQLEGMRERAMQLVPAE